MLINSNAALIKDGIARLVNGLEEESLAKTVGAPPYRLAKGEFSMQARLQDLIVQAFEVRPYQL